MLTELASSGNQSSVIGLDGTGQASFGFRNLRRTRESSSFGLVLLLFAFGWSSKNLVYNRKRGKRELVCACVCACACVCETERERERESERRQNGTIGKMEN